MPMLPGILLNCLMCIDCQRKHVRPMTKGVVVQPILSKEFSARGQVDLIDMQSLTAWFFQVDYGVSSYKVRCYPPTDTIASC